MKKVILERDDNSVTLMLIPSVTSMSAQLSLTLKTQMGLLVSFILFCQLLLVKNGLFHILLQVEMTIKSGRCVRSLDNIPIHNQALVFEKGWVVLGLVHTYCGTDSPCLMELTD